ncbi:MAG: NAD(P)-dependent oxidoreductase [Maribacter sp.]
MKNTSKIAVIGGTGKSGKYLVQQLLKNGYRLKMLVRNPDNFTIDNSLAEVVYGDVRDYETVKLLLQQCDVVISTLGGTPLSEPTVFSKATKNILNAMSEFGIKRYIVTTGLHVDTPNDKKNPKVQFGTDWMHKNFPKSTADRQVEFELLSESRIDWTLVRLPLIILTDDQKEINISLEDCPGDSISATDLAIFLIAQIKDKTFLQKAPFISNV